MADEQPAEQPTASQTSLDAVAASILQTGVNLASAYFGEKIKTLNIKNYRVGTLAENASKHEANLLGLSVKDVNPYVTWPAKQQVDMKVEQSATGAAKEPLWKTALKWAIPTLIGGAVTGGSLWGAGLLGAGKVIEKIIEQKVEVPVEGDHQPGEVGLTVE